MEQGVHYRFLVRCLDRDSVVRASEAFDDLFYCYGWMASVEKELTMSERPTFWFTIFDTFSNAYVMVER